MVHLEVANVTDFRRYNTSVDYAEFPFCRQ